MTTFHCPTCGTTSEPDLQWQSFQDSSRHLRASCPECGKFFRYAEQTPENVARARPVPPPGPSLFDLIDRL